jgi:alpha-tubulin suppressor-like RCC1 family protein
MGFARFGNGNIANSLTGFTKTIVSTDSGYERSVVLFSDGTVAAWADWTFPSNTAIGSGGASPYKYLGLPSGVTKFTKIYLNYNRNLSLISEDGSVWYWLGNHTLGNNGYVKVYDASTNSSIKAVKVNLDGNVNTDGTIGGNSTIFILLENGSLMAGGKNWHGCFGNTNYDVGQYLSAPQVVYTPTELTNEELNLTKVTVVTLANACSLITKGDGSVWGAGVNNGFGTYKENSTNYIVNLNKNVKQVSTNSFSTAIVTPDNKLYTKGQNNFGQLGLGDTTNRDDYTLVDTTNIVTTGVEILFVSMGGGFIPGGAIYGHLLMILSNGEVWACGRNNFGQAGYGNIEQNTSFTKIYTPDPLDEQTRAFTCSSGKLDSMFVLRNGTVYRCNNNNKLTGPTIEYQPDVNPTNPGDKYPAIYASVGPFHSGIITADGSVWMIGNDIYAARLNNLFSAFGLGFLSEDEFKTIFPNWHTAGTYNDSNGNLEYKIEINQIGSNITPLFNRVTELNKYVRTYQPEKNGGVGSALLSCGGDTQGNGFTAIFLLDGSIYTTGANDRGQLGTGNNIGRTSWIKVFDPIVSQSPAKTVLCSEYSTSIIFGGGVYSTGANDRGQLGTGDRNNSNTFVPMKSLNTFDTLNTAYALNDAQGLVITAPAFGPFNIDSKLYGSSPFTITVPTSVSQGVFSFSSSDSTIASINSVTGEITINNTGKLGTVTIRATQAPWKLYTDTAYTETTFTVLPLNPQLTSFSIDQKWLNSRTLGVSPFNDYIKPTSLSIGAFSYSSSNTSVATINSSTGAITIVEVGSTTITVTQAADGIYDTASKSTTFIVNPLQNPNLSNFTISDVLYSVDSTTFTPPTHLGDGAITYTSSNPIDASIDSTTGLITFNKNGSIGLIEITATLKDNGIYAGSSKSTTFRILPISPNLRSFSIPSKILGSDNFLITVPTSDNLNSGFYYTISDENVAKFINNKSTEIEIVGVGSTTIRVTQIANGIYDTEYIEATFTVLPRISPNLRGFVNESKPYGSNNFYISPPTSDSLGSITYTSSDETIAIIDLNTGLVSINTNGKTGNTTITATHAISGIYQLETITKTLTISQISPNLRNFSISDVNFEYDLPGFPVTAPLYNGNGVITYTSNIIDPITNRQVATINSYTGYITVLNPGRTTITATLSASDPYFSTSISTIILVKPLADPNLTLFLDQNIQVPIINGISPFELKHTSLSTGSLIYSSSNEDIATIDSNGYISVKQPGTVIIYATQNPTSSYDYAYSQIELEISQTNSSNPISINTVDELQYSINETNTKFIKVSYDISNINKLKRNTNETVKITSNVTVKITN